MKKIGIILPMALLLSASCNKVCELPEENLLMERHTISSVVSYQSMADVFKSINPTQLQTYVSTNNNAAAATVLKNLATKVQAYLKANYDTNFNMDVDLEYQEILVLGIIYTKYEQEQLNGQATTLESATNNQVDCVFAVLMGTITGSEIIAIVNDFRRGVSAATIIGTLKTTLRRVASAISVALMVYEVGDCLEWW